MATIRTDQSRIDAEQVKFCTKCSNTKPVSSFSKKRTTKDGLQAWCKSCCRTGNATWKAKYPDRAKASQAKSYQKNKVARSVYHKEWRAQNMEYLKDYYAEWMRKNPYNKRISNALRRKMVLEQRCPLDCVTVDAAHRLTEAFGGLCAYGCGRLAQAFDHVRPVSKRGMHCILNLVPACGICNSSKKAKLLSTWLGATLATNILVEFEKVWSMFFAEHA